MTSAAGDAGTDRPGGARDDRETATFAPVPIGRGGAFVERAWRVYGQRPLLGAPGRGATHPPRENKAVEVALLVSSPDVAQLAAPPERALVLEEASPAVEVRGGGPQGEGGVESLEGHDRIPSRVLRDTPSGFEGGGVPPSPRLRSRLESRETT